MHRDPSSHKGENGKVAVIGGSRSIHGAPLFSALAAEASGVDLVTVCLPECHEDVAKMMSLNFFVHPFRGDELTKGDLNSILELLASLDVAVIGPGIARTKETLDALMTLIEEAACPLVLDASALQPETLERILRKMTVLTPHLGELERMGLNIKNAAAASKKSGAVIFVKAQVDTVFAPDGRRTELRGGNAGLTVGGTGDALAGLIAGLIAQKRDPFAAAVVAGGVLKRAGTVLFPEKGYAYTTRDVIREIPHLLHTYQE